MNKMFKRLFYSQNEDSIKDLIQKNKSAVQDYNNWLLKNSLIIACVLASLAVVLSFFFPEMETLRPSYLLCLASFLALILIFGSKAAKRKSVIGLYILFTMFFALTVYLSCLVSVENPAAMLLAFLCLAPVLITDFPIRVNLYTTLLYVVHTCLAYTFKPPEIAATDCVNGFVTLVLGIMTQYIVMDQKLKNFDARRLLELEKVTDVLTTLGNRRKLFETMELIESGSAEPPTGVFMADIDFFKSLNDDYGHAAGDRCLHALGKFLKEYENRNIISYRYGGEEFVIFVYDCDLEQIKKIADEILTGVQKLETGVRPITISIGAVECFSDNRNYDFWIDIADQCVYTAKRNGRNQVVLYNPNEALFKNN